MPGSLLLLGTIIGYSVTTSGLLLSKLAYSYYYDEYKYGDTIIGTHKNSRYKIKCYSSKKRICDIDDRVCYYYKGKRMVPEEVKYSDYDIYPLPNESRINISGKIPMIGDLFPDDKEYNGNTKYILLMNPDTGAIIYDNKVDNLLYCNINSIEKDKPIYHIWSLKNKKRTGVIGYSNQNYFNTWLRINLMLRPPLMFTSQLIILFYIFFIFFNI